MTLDNKCSELISECTGHNNFDGCIFKSEENKCIAFRIMSRELNKDFYGFLIGARYYDVEKLLTSIDEEIRNLSSNPSANAELIEEYQSYKARLGTNNYLKLKLETRFGTVSITTNINEYLTIDNLVVTILNNYTTFEIVAGTIIDKELELELEFNGTFKLANNKYPVSFLADDALSGMGGGKVRVLGRERKVVMRGRKQHVTYNKKLITLAEARRIERRR